MANFITVNIKELKSFLEEKVLLYNVSGFIEHDPISILHEYKSKEDKEIIGFITATLSWGRRDLIIRSANRISEMMDHRPHDFIMNHGKEDIASLLKFKHRTFNGEDLQNFVTSLRYIYKNHGGLEQVFLNTKKTDNHYHNSISLFKEIFFSVHSDNQLRTKKHVADPIKGSAAKRLHMFLRWMIRNDGIVDLGIWKSHSPSDLSLPLDVHTSRTSRTLNLLKRKQNDLKAVMELDVALRELDPDDPIKYDFALFGLGVVESFGKD